MTSPNGHEYTQGPWEDIGYGVRIQKRYVDGALGGVGYKHPRHEGSGDCEGYIAVKPEWADGWDVLSVEPLTLSPSMRCRACEHHGFIKEGRWVPA